MNWKEFLKPNKIKSLLTILFLVLLVLSIFVFARITVYSIILFILLAPHATLLLYQYGAEGSTLGLTVESIAVIMTYVVEVIYLYLLSCLVVWTYSKFKKKK